MRIITRNYRGNASFPIKGRWSFCNKVPSGYFWLPNESNEDDCKRWKKPGPCTSETTTIFSRLPSLWSEPRSLNTTHDTDLALVPILCPRRLSPRLEPANSAKGREKSRKRKNATSHATWNLSLTIRTNMPQFFLVSRISVWLVESRADFAVYDRFVRACVAIQKQISKQEIRFLSLNWRGIAAPRVCTPTRVAAFRFVGNIESN